LCRVIVLVLAAAYAVALGFLAIGRFGLLGQEPDPVAAVPLVLLGTPWIWLVDRAPQQFWPWLAAMAPMPTLLLLAAVCRAMAAKRT